MCNTVRLTIGFIFYSNDLRYQLHVPLFMNAKITFSDLISSTIKDFFNVNRNRIDFIMYKHFNAILRKCLDLLKTK